MHLTGLLCRDHCAEQVSKYQPQRGLLLSLACDCKAQRSHNTHIGSLSSSYLPSPYSWYVTDYQQEQTPLPQSGSNSQRLRLSAFGANACAAHASMHTTPVAAHSRGDTKCPRRFRLPACPVGRSPAAAHLRAAGELSSLLASLLWCYE